MYQEKINPVVTTHLPSEERSRQETCVSPELAKSGPPIQAALLTGCQDRPYALGLAMALIARGIKLDVVGSDEIDTPEVHTTPNLHFKNLRGRLEPYDPFVKKLSKFAIYYVRLFRYIATSNCKLVHILWNNKFEFFDRTVLMLYYKLCGKKISFTAHNVNQAKRDLKDSLLNRLTLRIQYRLSDHVFVHTQKMKAELCQDFGVPEKAITVIRHPINDAFPCSDLTPTEAKNILGLRGNEKIILFLGRLRPYKGIELLLAAFHLLVASGENCRLVIAGAPNKGDEDYLKEIQTIAESDACRGKVLLRAEFIPDSEIELYLKGADVMVLPYKDIFQSGVLFLAYSFGLPVVATDVGSFREEIVEGQTGFICKRVDPADMAATLKRFFCSDIYRNLPTWRGEIKDYAYRVHSWGSVAELTRNAYARLLEDRS